MAVPLLHACPDLARHLDPEALAAATSRVQVSPVAHGRGELALGDPPHHDELGLLLVEGFVVVRTTLGHRTSAELVGPGELVFPGAFDDEHSVYPFGRRCVAITPVLLARLDRVVTAELCAFPQIVAELMGRLVVRCRRQGGHATVAQLASVEHRILLLLWHLADEFGRVESARITLALPLTHVLIGELVGARRPSVTGALGRLVDQGLLEPLAGGGWSLVGAPPEDLQLVRGHRGAPARLAAVRALGG